MGNDAAIMEVDENVNHEIITFGPAPDQMRSKKVQDRPDYYL